jgi:hypothetical protein
MQPDRVCCERRLRVVFCCQLAATPAHKEDEVVAETSYKRDLLFYGLSGIVAAWGLCWIVGLLVITQRLSGR